MTPDEAMVPDERLALGGRHAARVAEELRRRRDADRITPLDERHDEAVLEGGLGIGEHAAELVELGLGERRIARVALDDERPHPSVVAHPVPARSARRGARHQAVWPGHSAAQRARMRAASGLFMRRAQSSQALLAARGSTSRLATAGSRSWTRA